MIVTASSPLLSSFNLINDRTNNNKKYNHQCRLSYITIILALSLIVTINTLFGTLEQNKICFIVGPGLSFQLVQVHQDGQQHIDSNTNKNNHNNIIKSLSLPAAAVTLSSSGTVVIKSHNKNKNRTNFDDRNYNNNNNQPNEDSIIGCKNYSYTNGTWVWDNTRETYIWKVYNEQRCQLREWSTDAFCEVLNKRNVLIVGDSISGNFHRSLIHAFGEHGSGLLYQKILPSNKLVEIQRTAYICNNTSEITYRRNDWMIPNIVLAPNVTKKTVHIPWKHLLNHYDVIVLNAGAHVRPIKDYKKTLYELKKLFIKSSYNGTVLFRTTPRGHKYCSIRDNKPIQRYSSIIVPSILVFD
jgi:hypothetical protein